MLARINNFAETLRESYWFLPTVMLAGAGGLAAGAGYLDGHHITKETAQRYWLYGGDLDAARALLSTVGGSAITVAGTVFSITIAALALASSQFGPRLLRNFVRDRANQFVLGTFVATYLYCLLVQRSLTGIADGRVPHLSITIALALGLASLVVLVFFIHHVAAAIQAPHLAAAVAKELFTEIDELYPDPIALDVPDAAGPDADASGRSLPPHARMLIAATDGYLQAIDEDDLLAVVVGCDAVIELLVRPGAFIVRGQPIARLHAAAMPDADAESQLRDALMLGHHRTAEQDIEYSIDQLVEVCLRALSPAINDPFTAQTCVDWLGAAMSRLAGRAIPSHERLDGAGRVRILTRRTDFAGAMGAAFHQPRQIGTAHVSVSIRLLATLGVVASHCRDASRRAVVRRHLDATLAAALSRHEQPIDVEAIRAIYDTAAGNLGS